MWHAAVLSSCLADDVMREHSLYFFAVNEDRLFQHPPCKGCSDCQQIHGGEQRHGRVQRSQCKERMKSAVHHGKTTVGNESMEHFRLTLNWRVLYLLSFL